MKTVNNLLPRGWVWVRLGEVAEILDNKRIPVNADKREKRIVGKSPSELIPYYGATGQVGWIDDFLFDEELVLLGEDGAPFFESLKNKAYIIKGKSWVNNHAHVLRAIDGIILNSFICNYLNVFDYHGYVTGTTRPKLNQSSMKQIPIPLPPLSEQKRIVAKIEELFTRLEAGVEALKKVKAQIRHYRQAVLKYAFEGKLTEKWRRNNPSSVQSEENSEKLEKDEILRSAQNDKGAYNENMPELPEGWRWVKLGEIAEINPKFSGYDISDHTEVTFLSMKCVEELTGHIDLSNIKRLSEVKKGYTPFIEGDVLFAKITPCMENGKVAIAHNLKNGIGFGSTEFHVIRPTELLLNKFLFFYFIREDFRKNAQSYMTGSAGQLRVPASYMQQTLIPLPPLPEQHQIVEEIERRFSVIEQVEKIVDQSLKQAERLRQSILKRAFEGKLVPQDPNDEPVEKLLERIKQQREQSDKMRTSKRKRRK